MKKSKALGKLLRKERESLNLKLGEVTQKMGFLHYQTLSSIEAGEREIKAWELFKLAELYGRNLDYFIIPRKTVRPQPKVLWRDPARTTETMTAERKFLSFCQNYKKLLELTKESETKLPVCDFSPIDKQEFSMRGFDYVAELSRQYSKLLNLGGRPACSLPSILEQVLAILVFYMDLGPGGSGASTHGDFGRAILVNANDAPWRRNYDLAHELFHLITWDTFSDEDIYSQSKEGKSEVEQWADFFASEILLPGDEVEREFSKRVSDNEITYISLVEIAREFRVSIDALLWRLVNLRCLERKNVKELLEKGTIKDIDRKMRTNDWADDRPPYLSSRFVTLAIKALQMGKISKAKFAEYVDKPFSEVPYFLEKYGYDENEDYLIAFATTRFRRNH
jgi:Zn-dependent peptidase ImmA (M78 family)/transcriptional regulator with XRE-family HTH domain